MSVVALTRRLFAGTARLLAPPRREFMCCDCARWERCGLPPDPHCAEREEKIAQETERPWSRYLPAEFLPFK
jgi:hypothetical protein